MRSSVLKYLTLILMSLPFNPVHADNGPLFPTGIAWSPDGHIVMTEKGLDRIALYSSDGKKLTATYELDSPPTGVAVAEGKIFVTTFGSEGRLHIMDLADGKEHARIETGSGACSPVPDLDRGKVYVCNRFRNTVSEVDVRSAEVTRTVRLMREPVSAAMTKDGRYLYVTNFLPTQRADAGHVSACVSVIDIKTFRRIKDISLANGSNAVRNICMSPDGNYAYVCHNLGRYTVPTSQLHQGWMNTSALSIIDIREHELLGTVVTDEPERGAAGIWDVECDENNIYISHSGTHEISVIRQKEMLRKFIDTPDRSAIEYDLTFLKGIRTRIDMEGNGPRAICLSGEKLYVPTYFADILNVYDPRTGSLDSVDLNPGRTETDINKGEKFFNDASNCFQGWQSCNGCHPGDGRADGMNWDLMNDGVGNPKNCKSLLFSHVTPPSMISGIRSSAEWAVRAGFKFIQFFNISEEDAACVDAYLKSLEPVPSPYLVDGELSEKAKKGKEIYHELKCDDCHGGGYYTDLQMYRIGEDIEFDQGWDTPTLRECWRTAPYLFDGRAATMQEVFEVHRHGIDRKISKKEIEALTEYVNSL